MSNISKATRVRQELSTAGITGYGLMRSESRYLPEIIHDDEHIMGAIYGRYENGSAMLIATDHRVIFLDRKPFFTTSDELTYEVVSGVLINRGGLFYTVTLHTRIADYTIHYVNAKSAQQFVKYIETRRLENDVEQPVLVINSITPAVSAIPVAPDSPMHFLDDQALVFLKDHDTAVVSSMDRTGNVFGDVTYYMVDQLNHIFILTKSGTAKARNILGHSQVSLTIFEADEAQTLTIQGFAEIETHQPTKDYVFATITKARNYGGEIQPPPVTKLSDGAFTIIRITPTSGKYVDYKRIKA